MTIGGIKKTAEDAFEEISGMAKKPSPGAPYDDIKIYEISDDDEVVGEISSKQSSPSQRSEDVVPSVSAANTSDSVNKTPDIAGYAAGIDSLTSRFQTDADVGRDSLSAPEAHSVEVYDVPETFFKNEILNLARDFVLRFVTGFEDANEKNFLSYIASRNEKTEEKENVLPSPVVTEIKPSVPEHQYAPSSVLTLKDIGYEVVNLKSVSDEEYSRMFKSNPAEKANEKPISLGAYKAFGGDRNKFIDLDLLFGVSSTGKYSLDEYLKAESAKRNNQPAQKQPDIDEPGSIVVSIPEEDIRTIDDHFVLKPVDLMEAEKIANEDILFLSEEDLIEELEQIDLTPIDELEEAHRYEQREREINNKRVNFYNNLNQLSAPEVQDIESDISRDTALVIEENVEDIRQELSALRYFEEKPVAEALPDITDRIVILDDLSSIEAALADFAPKKKEDMKHLLSYLDGLFEKLPEDVVRKFAESEYFDLYVKILNELGV